MHDEPDGDVPSALSEGSQTRLYRRSNSCNLAWSEVNKRMPKQVETIAEGFATIGLSRCAPVVPLNPDNGEDLVLASLCLFSATDELPTGFDPIWTTNCGKKAILSHSSGSSTSLYLAQRVMARKLCQTPITALLLLDGGEKTDGIPDGFEPIKRTADAEKISFGLSIYVSRECAETGKPEAPSTPLQSITVLAREDKGRSVRVPAGFEIVDGFALGSSRAERWLAFNRASPCSLLQTPLKVSILDSLHRGINYHVPPVDINARDDAGPANDARASASDAGADEAEDDSGDDDSGGGESGSSGDEASDNGAFSAAVTGAAGNASNAGLPSALPHFCIPQGARLRLECPWPTAHEFALTDQEGSRLYGCCLVVWEPLDNHALLLMRPETTDERLKAKEKRSHAKTAGATTSRRPTPPMIMWDDVEQAWVDPKTKGGSRAAQEKEKAATALQLAFSGEHRVVIVPRPKADHNALEKMVEKAEVVGGFAEENGGSGGIAFDPSESHLRTSTLRSRSFSQQGDEARPLRRRWTTSLVINGRGVYAPTALCVLSRHPFLSSLRHWLCELYRHSLSSTDVPLERLIASLLWESPLPRPTVSVSVSLGREEVLFARHAPASELPIRELRMSALLHALTPAEITKLFAAACVEHKIILVSHFTSQLTPAAEALLSLLWPLSWLNVYIPVLPLSLIDVLGSPVPYLLGCHTDTFEAAAVAGVLPDDAVVVRLDLQQLVIPARLEGLIPHLPDASLLLGAIVEYNHICPAVAEDAMGRGEAAQAHLAFPLRELGGASLARDTERRESAQRLLRHAFASWWAKLLAGYQDHLRTVGADVTSDGSVDSVLHLEGLLTSRDEAHRPLLMQMLQTQGLVRMLEQRAGFSTRDAEFVLFDTLADQYRPDAPATLGAGELPALPRAPPARVYAVPPPEPISPAAAADGSAGVSGGFGPFQCWPLLRHELMHTPRPIPPLNFDRAPPSMSSLGEVPSSSLEASMRSEAAPVRVGRAKTEAGQAATAPAANTMPPASPAVTPAVTPAAAGAVDSESPGSGRPKHKRSMTAPAGKMVSLLNTLSRRSSHLPSPKVASSKAPRTMSTVAVEPARARSFSFGLLGVGANAPLPTVPQPRAPMAPSEWARERLGEVLACALICRALCIPRLTDPSSAVEDAIDELDTLASMQPIGIVPPQCAYHALLRACSHCKLPEHSRTLISQLQRAGRRPDAQTIGWLSHALTLLDSGGSTAGSFVNSRGEDWAEESVPESALEGNQDADASVVKRTASSRRSLSFGTGEYTFTDEAPAPAPADALGSQGDGGGARRATLCIGNTCARCGAEMGAAEVVTGWFARSERDGHDYGCECPRCNEPWQPLLTVTLQRLREGSLSQGDGASCGKGAGEETIECPLLSPVLLLRELEALVETSRDRSTLRHGWSRARHLFPSVFWSLCWHTAPVGMLEQLLPQLELRVLSISERGESFVLWHPDGSSERESDHDNDDLVERVASTSLGAVEEASDDGELAPAATSGQHGEAAPSISFDGWVRGGHFVKPLSHLQRRSSWDARRDT